MSSPKTTHVSNRVLDLTSIFQPKPIDVQVISHQMQRYAVWFGGSMLASTVRLGVNIFLCFSPRSFHPSVIR